jgi:hypothetical protein
MIFNKTPFIIFLCCLFAGILFFLIQRQWLIIHWASYTPTLGTKEKNKTGEHKKKLSLFYWKNDKFFHDDTYVIWYENTVSENLKTIITKWLTYITDEKILPHTPTIESVAILSTKHEAIISFSAIFDWKEWSIFKKWILIESLCKTIKSVTPEINSLIFLVKNEPMHDEHLDFSHPWPIEGYCV